MNKSELRELIRLAIEAGDMQQAQTYKELLKKELDDDLTMRFAYAKDLDDFIEMGIWLDDY